MPPLELASRLLFRFNQEGYSITISWVARVLCQVNTGEHGEHMTSTAGT